MTDTPEGAPSKRAMEVVPQVFIAAGHMPQLRLAEIERAARLLDAEFRNGEELAKAAEQERCAKVVEAHRTSQWRDPGVAEAVVLEVADEIRGLL
jgi:hypothetical protein